MWQKLFGARSRYALSPDEMERFRQQGFLGPLTAFTPEEMARFRPTLEKVLRTPSPYTSYFTQMRHLDSRTVWNLCSAPAIVDRMASLFGPDLILWYSNLFNKPPASPEQPGEYPWHQDRWFYQLEPM